MLWVKASLFQWIFNVTAVSVLKWKCERSVWYFVWYPLLHRQFHFLFCTLAKLQLVVQLHTVELTNPLKHWNKTMNWKHEFSFSVAVAAVAVQFTLNVFRIACVMRSYEVRFPPGSHCFKSQTRAHVLWREYLPQRGNSSKIYFNTAILKKTFS